MTAYLRNTNLYLLMASMLLVVGCNLSRSDDPAETPDIPAPLETFTPSGAPLAPTASPLPPVLRTESGALANYTGLLDGVCFGYLQQMAGQWWLWDSAEEFDAFFDAVNDSELCPERAATPAFDFADVQLVGLVSALPGCDAAHRVLVAPPTTAGDALQLIIEPRVLRGCAYELVEPLLVAVPRALIAGGIQVEVRAAVPVD